MLIEDFIRALDADILVLEDILRADREGFSKCEDHGVKKEDCEESLAFEKHLKEELETHIHLFA